MADISEENVFDEPSEHDKAKNPRVMMPTKVCIACQSLIPVGASLCRDCGTRQNTSSRLLFRIAAYAAVFTTVISLMTTAIAFAPTAYGLIVKSPKPRIIELDFDSDDPTKRKLGDFSLFNGGNTNAYVTKVLLRPSSNKFSEVGTSEFSIFGLMKPGEGMEMKIGYPFSNVRSRFSSKPMLLDANTYPIVTNAIEDKKVDPEQCLMLVPMDARLGLDAPENGEFRRHETITTLEGELFYIDRSNPTSILSAPIEDLYIEAALYFHPYCIWKLGGEQTVTELFKG